MSAPFKPARKSDPYRWYMSLDMAPHAGFLLLAMLAISLISLFRLVFDWPPFLQLAALALALTLLSTSVWLRRRHLRKD